jgi:hypothetical protein
MAITSEFTLDANFPASKQPDSYSAPSVTALTGTYYTSAPMTMTIAATNFEHASVPATGLTAGISAVKTEFDTNWDTTLLKFDAALTVDIVGYITNIVRTNDRSEEYVTGSADDMVVTFYINWQ